MSDDRFLTDTEIQELRLAVGAPVGTPERYLRGGLSQALTDLARLLVHIEAMHEYSMNMANGILNTDADASFLTRITEIVGRIPLDAQLPGTPLLTDCLDHLVDQYIVKARQHKLLEADTAALIQAGELMRRNLSPWAGKVGSELYQWDEVVKQTTAIGAVELLRKAEMATELVRKVERLEADLTFGVFPGWRSYEEWVAAGRPTEAEKQTGQDSA